MQSDLVHGDPNSQGQAQRRHKLLHQLLTVQGIPFQSLHLGQNLHAFFDSVMRVTADLAISN
jgi:hypothetical protein